LRIKLAEPVADGVIRIHAPLPLPDPDHINCYLLEVDGDQVLVDTGMRGSEGAIDDALARFGVRVDRVLLTHGHPDHWGLARRYADTALAHPDIRAQMVYAEDRRSPVGVLGVPPGTDVEGEAIEYLIGYTALTCGAPHITPILDGDRIGDWEVLVTPGHAPGHVCLYRRSDRVLIAGDHLLPEVTPNIHLTTEMPDAVADYLGALRRVASLDVRLVLPSHGEPFTDAAARAAELIYHHERRLARLEELLCDDGPADTARLAHALFKDAGTPAHRLLAEMETYAHLEHLRLRGRVSLSAVNMWAVAGQSGSPDHGGATVRCG
jgi:glyoxylase-like metal-dependent hydrolase (beta-lactamase superfamily II)